MNKPIILLLGLAAALSASSATVTTETAANYGREFLDMAGKPGHAVKNIAASTTEWTVINYAPQGWAVISADDAVRPVLAYSLTGSIDYFTMPSNMRAFLSGYAEKIKNIRGMNLRPDYLWNAPAGTRSRAYGDKVEPLIKVNWNQDRPFNQFCPSGALVGCVAVSMSQAMSVQQYPSAPKGSASYNHSTYGLLEINFDEQRAYNWKDILSGSGNYSETARLLHHAGMSVMMNYGTEGSGIPSNEIYRISNALINNFSYPKTVSYHYRDRYNDTQWEQLVLNELMAGRAVIYNAIDTKGNYGHSFNVDGYDGMGLYHLNWGWGGYGNGYFALDNLADAAMNMNYDAGHRIVIGIVAPDSPFYSLDISDTRIEENTPAGSVVAVASVNGGIPDAGITLSVHGLFDSTTGKYETTPFEFDGPLLRTTRDILAGEKNIDIMVTASDQEGNSITQGFVMSVMEPRTLEQATSLSFDRNSGVFTLKTKHNVSYRLTSPSGTVIASGDAAPAPTVTFNRSILESGANTLTLTCGNDTKTIVIRN